MLINSSGFSKLKESINNSITEKIFLGHKPSPELIAILVVYLVQGALGLSRLSVSFFLKDELQLSPVELSAILGIIHP